MEHSTTYPQYRKYKNNKAYFKIISAKEWEEKQILGSRVSVHSFEVKILPDRNFIHDMTFDYSESWDVISAEEYEAI
jgi:hypothetical protein